MVPEPGQEVGVVDPAPAHQHVQRAVPQRADGAGDREGRELGERGQGVLWRERLGFRSRVEGVHEGLPKAFAPRGFGGRLGVEGVLEEVIQDWATDNASGCMLAVGVVGAAGPKVMRAGRIHRHVPGACTPRSEPHPQKNEG